MGKGKGMSVGAKIRSREKYQGCRQPTNAIFFALTGNARSLRQILLTQGNIPEHEFKSKYTAQWIRLSDDEELLREYRNWANLRELFQKLNFRNIPNSEGLNLSGLDVRESTFEGATLKDVKAIDTDFRECCFVEAWLVGGDYSHSVLADCDLSNIRTRKSRDNNGILSKVNLKDVNCGGAWLTGADLRCADFDLMEVTRMATCCRGARLTEDPDISYQAPQIQQAWTPFPSRAMGGSGGNSVGGYPRP